MARDKLYESYLKEYNKLAKKADRRMRELERFSRDPKFESILNYAYRTAVKDIASWTPPDKRNALYQYDKDTLINVLAKPRWQRNAPADTNSLKAKIKDIEKFLKKPTSTMTGTVKIYKKRTETINKKYGTSFTWEQLADYFETGLADKASDKFGSKTVLQAIGVIQKNKKQVLDNIKEKTEVHIQVKNIAVQKAVNGMLSNYGVDLQAILN